MNSFKSLLKKLLFLPPLAAVIVAVISFSMVILTFAFTLNEIAIGYVSYVASAYALTILIIAIPNIVRTARKKIHNSALKKKIYSYPLGKRFFSDDHFRMNCLLYQGMAINVLYAAFKAVTAILYRSEWFGAIGAYYLVLSAIRILLIRGEKVKGQNKTKEETELHELKIYRKTGCMMFLLDLAMAGMVVQMIWKNRSNEYSGIIIYLSAMFSFYCLTIAIINIVKMIRKHKKLSPIHMATRALNLAGALMSIFALQTAMLAQFGKPNEVAFRQNMNMLTGGCVMLFIIGMAVFIIIYSNKLIKRITIKSQNNKIKD